MMITLSVALLCIVTAISSATQGCSPGWLHYRGHCYTFGISRLTYHEAKMFCLRLGGFVASIDRKPENDWITLQIKSFNLPYVWIGATDLVKESEFVWDADNSRLLHYTNWYKGEPNDAGKREDCTLTYPGGQWNDAPCKYKAPVLCEK